MKKEAYIRIIGLLVIIATLQVACVKEYIEVPQRPVPRVGKETDTLEATLVATSIASANDPFWNEANYLVVDLEDLNTHSLYPSDGLLNLTGTYEGLQSFNNGNATELRLRAAYDEENLYILAEWEDNTIDPSYKTWLWNGPEDPLMPNESSEQWSSQLNGDKIAMAFDINGASSSSGTFSNVGCAASCHSAGGNTFMSPESGSVDIWSWSVPNSAPFGYAFDMVTTLDSQLTYDSGTKYFHRNINDPGNNRSGPFYEWNGDPQDITESDGAPSRLDPGYFLLNKTEFIGDPLVGETLYADEDKGCLGCHGENGAGYGPFGDGPPFDDPGFGRKYYRESLDEFAISESHQGFTYYEKLSETEKDDLIAYINGLAGIPGYYFTQPNEGESLNDIKAESNLNFARIQSTEDHGNYRVLFIRKLQTGNTDDKGFDPSEAQAIPFGVALMDGDGKNHIGSLIEHLIFK